MSNAINSTNEIFAEIDRLFEEAPSEVEAYMCDSLMSAKANANYAACLKLYNELIGYYRQTSEREKLIATITGVCDLLSEMRDNTSLNYATTMLNIANAYRSIGELDLAKEHYAKTEIIYEEAIKTGVLETNDISVAGLYNNMSLLYQELSDYRQAAKLLKKALAIVTEQNEGFEIAVTYANLANTMLLAKDYEAAYKYAKESMNRFRARNYIDAHYCAALSAVASCYYEWGEINKARSLYTKAMQIVENTIGKNSQYERLADSVKMCESNANYKKYISGMELSRAYFEKYGLPILEDKYSEYKDKITVGLIGEGSDCYGFDDEYSTDHDYGPGFCLVIDDDIYEKIGDELASVYRELPDEFMGYKRQESALGQGRRGVIKTSYFYEKHLGTAIYEAIDFKNISDYELAVCCNGQIFYGGSKTFMDMRNKLLEGYPAKIRLLKLAEDVASFSQNGQYNFSRMSKREDDFSAAIMLSDFCRIAMKLYHYLINVYPPHDKWLKKSTLRLEGGQELVGLLEKVMALYKTSESTEKIAAAADEVGEYLAQALSELVRVLSSTIAQYMPHGLLQEKAMRQLSAI